MLCSLVAVLSACSQFGTEGIQLRVDESITILQPADRATVPVPLEVRWEDDRPIDGGAYVVVIDRTPMPPGETVAWFADDDDCAGIADCPDALWLARRGITVTGSTSATIEIVPEPDRSGRQELTIVRLDAQGRRADEAAFVVQFEALP